VALGEEWTMQDEGYARERILQVPRVDRYEQDVVHALALYLAESEHALKEADLVEDLLILDGPVYPTGLLQWADHDPELAELLVKDDVLDVVANYVDLVEEFVERDAALAGFVKSTTSKAITRIVRKEQGNAVGQRRRVLPADTRTPRRRGRAHHRRADVHQLVPARASGRTGCSRPAATRWASSGNSTTRAYEVTFFVVYDPREDLLYRVESPYGITRDEGTRDAITRQVLADVAAERGPPLAVRKADELARIGGDEKERSARRSNGSSTANNSASTTTSGGVCPSKSRLGRDRRERPSYIANGGKATREQEARRPDQASAPATSTRSTATSTSAAGTPLSRTASGRVPSPRRRLLALFEPRGIGDSKATRTSSSPNRWTVPGGDRVELVADPDERGALLGRAPERGARARRPRTASPSASCHRHPPRSVTSFGLWYQR